MIQKLIIILCLLSPLAHSQSGSQGEKMERSVPFSLFKTTSDTVPFSSLSKISFKDPAQFGTSDPNNIYWAKLDFLKYKPLLEQSNSKWVLQIGNLNKASLFYKKESVVDSVIMGSFELNAEFTGKFRFTKNQLLNNRYLYIKFSILDKRKSLAGKQFVFYPKYFENYIENHTNKDSAQIVALSYLLWGGVFIGIVISLAFYRTYRQPEYVYYTLYALSLALFLGHYGIGWYGKYVGNYSLATFVLNNGFELMAGLFYALFEKHFLNTRDNYPLLNTFINIAVAIFIVWLVLDTTIIAMGEYRLHFVLLDIRAMVLSILVLFAIVYLLFNFKTQLNWFIIIGSLIYGLGSILVYASGNGNYLRLAAAGEITVFSLGLGYKVRIENRQKMKAELKAAQSYLKLLLSQFNPHFVFNALNSIQHLVISGQRSGALNYLGKFSRLMRYALESSTQESIQLSKEISFLETYMSLESFRFDGKFQYNITVDDIIDPEAVEVPLLITQPFVENAIIHGLLPKKNGARKLSISFKRLNDKTLQCTIEDNGIGRQNSKMRPTIGRAHTSTGISLIKERLNFLHTEESKQQTVVINDLYDEEGNPMGTQVILNIFQNPST